jgi:polyisoprenoid-binding protein YceI
MQNYYNQFLNNSVKMKSVLFSTIALLTFSSVATAQTQAKSTPFVVDAAKSTFKWTAKKVTGSHWGNVKVASGVINTENGNVKNGNVTIDMKSIDVKDLEAAKGGDKLAGHLKGDDFFAVEKHPTAKLEIKSVAAAASGITCTADLTIKGITKEITFPATVGYADNVMTATADFKIDRTKWDIKYGSGSFFENLGNKAIDNDFEVNVKIEAVSEKPAPAAEAKPAKGAAKPTKKNTRKVPKTN